VTVIGLPGRNAETEDWMRSLCARLGFAQAEVLHYRHWDDPVPADAAFEAHRLAGRAIDMVIGKSLGTLVAALAHDAESFRPGLAILIGVPLRGLEDWHLAAYRRLATRVPTLFVQQSQDFTGSHAELFAWARSFERATVVEVPGTDHAYADLEALEAVIGPWLVGLNRLGS
jgi:pimeloyl-ACP methyl ester carboxylesterase